ncbi:restriction endonuclease subunit S, partial [Microbacterium esteraromaticum]
MKLLKIPLPPLKQQEKIAKWLETFSSLERQLERHKTQYRYYLNRLMRGGRLTELKEIIKEA